MPRTEKHASAKTLRRSSYSLLFSNSIKTTAKRRACPDILISAFLPRT